MFLLCWGFASPPCGGWRFPGAVDNFGGGVLLDGGYAFEGGFFVGVRFT
jgi:hypothetical protein